MFKSILLFIVASLFLFGCSNTQFGQSDLYTSIFHSYDGTFDCQDNSNLPCNVSVNETSSFDFQCKTSNGLLYANNFKGDLEGYKILSSLETELILKNDVKYRKVSVKHDKDIMLTLEKECRNIQKVASKKSDQLKEQKEQEEQKKEFERELEFERLAKENGVSSYNKESIDTFLFLRQGNLLSETNVMLKLTGLNLYRVKQQLKKGEILAVSPFREVSSRSMPIIIKSSKPMYDGQQLENSLVIYEGIRTYINVYGVNKQAAVFKFIKNYSY